MTWNEFKKVVLNSSSIQPWEGGVIYTPDDVSIGTDGNWYIALNPLDGQGQAITNMDKDPTNPVNNTFWKEINPTFGV